MNRHWANLIPDTGSFIPANDNIRGLTARRYKLTDGQLLTANQITRSDANVCKVSERTIRRRLDTGVRNPKYLYAN